MDGWKPKRRQPLRHFPEQFYPAGFQSGKAGDEDGSHYHKQGHWFVFEKNFPRDQDGEGHQSCRQGSRVGLIKVLQKVTAVFPEIPVGSMNAKQLRQLGAGEEQGDATLESRHHTFGDEIDDPAGFGQPGEESDGGGEQGRGGGQRTES